MKLLILLLIPFIATASPIDGMLGKTMPASFLVYVQFKDQQTLCRGGDDDFTLRVRTYHDDDIIIRVDTFKNRKLVAHYMPSLQTLFHLDKNGVIDRVMQMERYFPVQHCQVGRIK